MFRIKIPRHSKTAVHNAHQSVVDSDADLACILNLGESKLPDAHSQLCREGLEARTLRFRAVYRHCALYSVVAEYMCGEVI